MAAEEQSDNGPGLDFTAKLVILTSGVFSAMSLMAIASVLPSISIALAHGPNDAMLVKQLIGAVTLAMAVGAPLGGFLADRIGLRPTIFGAATLYVLAGTAGLYVNSLPVLLFSRLLLGLAAASMQVIGLTMVNKMLRGNARAKWVGLHVSLASFSVLVIQPIAGHLGEISWRLPFALYFAGATLIVGLLFGGRTVLDTTTAAPVAKTAEDTGPGILVWFPWHYLPLAFLMGAMAFLPSISIPFQLHQQAGATPSQIAYVLTASALVGSISALLYSRARLVLSNHGAFIVSFTLVGAGALLAANSTTLPEVICGLLIHSLGASWFVPNIMMAIGSKVPSDRQGRAAGIVKAAQFVSAPLCVLMVQPFVKQYGEVIAMQAVGVVGVFMTIIMILRTVTRAKPSPLPAQ